MSAGCQSKMFLIDWCYNNIQKKKKKKIALLVLLFPSLSIDGTRNQSEFEGEGENSETALPHQWNTDGRGGRR